MSSMNRIEAVGTAEERFWAKVEKQEGGCWLWTGAITSHGYGQFKVDGRLVGAHRFAYELLVGPIPLGLTLDHLCRIRHCVNPSHLEAVTNRENTLRGEGITARAARVTHCPQSHPYDLFNTYVSPRGDRRCRICARIHTRTWRNPEPEPGQYVDGVQV